MTTAHTTLPVFVVLGRTEEQKLIDIKKAVMEYLDINSGLWVSKNAMHTSLIKTHCCGNFSAILDNAINSLMALGIIEGKAAVEDFYLTLC